MKIGIVTLFDQSMQLIAERTLANKAAYAQRHGYPLVVEMQSLDPARPTAWSKLLAIKRHLDRFDWVFWCDIDALFVKFERRLEELVSRDHDLIIQGDRGPVGIPSARSPRELRVNTSHFLLRAGAWSHDLLDEAYRQTQFIDHRWWEQQAINHLLTYREALRRQSQILPPRAMFSPADEFHEGDFVVHFGGRGKEQRIDAFLRCHATSPNCAEAAAGECDENPCRSKQGSEPLSQSAATEYGNSNDEVDHDRT